MFNHENRVNELRGAALGLILNLNCIKFGTSSVWSE